MCSARTHGHGERQKIKNATAQLSGFYEHALLEQNIAEFDINKSIELMYT